MTNPKSRIIAAVAGALSMGAAAAWAEAPSQQDLKIRELEAKVAALEAKQAANSKDMAATIDSVLRDAEKRSQLLAASGDMSAGYDNGFFIRAGDAWVLRPTAQFDFRYVANWREDVTATGDNEWEDGFEVRRMKLALEGVAFSKDLTYKFQWASDRDGGGTVLEDAWARYMFADEFGIRAGQFKDPVYHEELTSSKYQLAVDRSLMNELISGGVTDYTQGVTLVYGGYNKNNPINAEIGLTDGAGEKNTNFVDNNFNFGVVGRVEWKAMGDWSAYRDFSAMNNKNDLLVVGLGGDWSQSGADNVFHAALDAQWETTGGLGVFGALVMQHADPEDGDESTNWGGLIQAGYMLNPSWELFARYDATFFDEDLFETDDEDDFHEITLGVNYFLGTNGSAGHRAKVTLDVTYLPEGAPGSISGIGILDANAGEDEWIIRTQFQLLI